MGKIKQGILGGFSGKVANIVGSSWKGIAYMKSLPLSVANPRTASQVSNRDRFSQTVAFAVAILVNAIKPLLDRIAVQQSGYNLFTSINKDNFDANGVSVPAAIEISRGNVAEVALGLLSYSSGLNQLTIPWVDNSGEGNALASDEMYFVVYGDDANLAYAEPTSKVRSDSLIGLNLPTELADQTNYHVYVACRRADGSEASNTVYATLAV